MFEAYTEAARKTLFIGLYEASQFGSEFVETEHLLLGLIRADLPLAIRIFKSPAKLEEMRERIHREIPHKEPVVSTAVDLPLSPGTERALNFASEQATRFHQRLVTSEHLLLGILHEPGSLAARIVLENGITFSQLEKEAAQITRVTAPPDDTPVRQDDLRDLVAEAEAHALPPLIGRERELEQVIRILLRRTKNNPLLIGDPGVGKDSVVHGLAHRIAEGKIPESLFGRQILAVDASQFVSRANPSVSRGPAAGSLLDKLLELSRSGNPIIYVRGLFDLREAMPALATLLAKARLQIIATGAPVSLRLALQRDDGLVNNFEPVSVLPATAQDTLEILHGIKSGFEQFHDVVFSPEAIETALSACVRFFYGHPLPDRAIDLIDDAGAGVRLQCDAEPPEIAQLQRDIRRLAKNAEEAIAAHNFEKARHFSQEERNGRDALTRLREEVSATPRSNTVTHDDIVDVVAARISISPAAVKAALQQTEPPDRRNQIRAQLAARVPVGRRDWIEGLVSYLADCSQEDTDYLLEAIRTASEKAKGARA